MKWVKPYVLNIIVAMNVSLRNEIEVTNGDINKTIVEKSEFVTLYVIETFFKGVTTSFLCIFASLSYYHCF